MKVSFLILLTILANIIKSQPSQEITPLMLCASCKAIINVSLKQLDGRKSELDVTDVLEYICATTNFPDFEFPPPYMGAACEKIIRAHYDDIEDLLIESKSEVDLDQMFCTDSLKICSPAMDVSLANKDMEKGPDGKYDIEKLRAAMEQRGGDIKIAGGDGLGDMPEDLFAGIGENMNQANFIEDL